MSQITFLENRLFPVLLAIIGLGMLGIWIKDIASGKFSGQGHFFKWVEGEGRLCLHIVAEFLTGIVLILAAIGLFYEASWSKNVAFVGLGAVIYSAINSSGWVIHKKERIPYGIPMWITLLISMCILFVLF